MSSSGGSSGGGGIQVATVALDAAEIATLNTAPTEIVAAPGANRVLVLVEAMFVWVPGVDGFMVPIGPKITWTDASTGPANHATDDLPDEPYVALIAAGPTPGSAFDTGPLTNAPFMVAAGADPERAGPIATSALDDGGLGYVVGDTGTIDGFIYDGGAAYVVDTVAPVTGAVLTYHLTAAGDGYVTTLNPLATTPGGAQPGVGAGLTLNVTAIPAADGVLNVTVLYKVLPTT